MFCVFFVLNWKCYIQTYKNGGHNMTLSQRLEKNCNKLIFDCTDEELFYGILKTIDELKNTIKSHETKKKLYYISAEFLIGKLMECNLINLGIYDEICGILKEYGKDLSRVTEIEVEPSLGNGGLGRLAACFLDSIAHNDLYGDGVGLLYHYGLFKQVFRENMQQEETNPWIDKNTILNKTDISYIVPFGDCTLKSRLYTVDIISKNRINKLNLFDIETADESMVGYNNRYDKSDIKRNLTLFLYPDDSDDSGKRLRLYQEYFMASNAAQLIIEETIRRGGSIEELADYAVVQINDTHPSLVIPELIRLLCQHGMDMDTSISTVCKMCAYTNHTILSEALEKWKVETVRDIIPDIYTIIKELDKRVKDKYKDKALHIIDENLLIHMARMDIHYGFSVNGVAALHSKILEETELNNFYNIYPQKFSNKTNGISMRRWLTAANPRLDTLIVSLIGDGFRNDYKKLKDLEKYIDDEEVLSKLLEIKSENKADLCDYISAKQGISLDPNSVFDVQIKRLHEYKRQQMNVLQLISKYLDIKRGILPKRPISAIFGAKAAPAYTIAKDIIHLILCMQELISKDASVKDYLQIVMVENYNVSWAEKIIPAADISEQISLASKEASGTGNMKLMLNGALTLGTRDGANIEISSLVGDDNIYTFGKSSDEVINCYKKGCYNPKDYYEKDLRIKEAVDFIISDELVSLGNKSSLTRLKNELTNKDYFMTFPDFTDYKITKERILSDYENRIAWARRMLINIANAGYFSSDRTITEYNKDIWRII